MDLYNGEPFKNAVSKKLIHNRLIFLNMMDFNLSNQRIGAIDLDVITAMVIISQIQLATRHPGNTGPGSKIAKDFARKLQEMVTVIAPENAAIIEMGWNPNFDV